ncbi:MAG: hypothetical protein HC933_07265 [Pleurocapsa sp. SU_196_0]|nr:hypothetical protein [Pleurocapsa sp. SU_196_0]
MTEEFKLQQVFTARMWFFVYALYKRKSFRVRFLCWVVFEAMQRNGQLNRLVGDDPEREWALEMPAHTRKSFFEETGLPDDVMFAGIAQVWLMATLQYWGEDQDELPEEFKSFVCVETAEDLQRHAERWRAETEHETPPFQGGRPRPGESKAAFW